LLTLPGAVLWSLPIGIATWGWLQRYVPTIPLPSSMVGYAICLGFVLVPGAVDCSFMAMELFSESQSNHGVSVKLLLFNQVTTVFASVGTLAEAIDLVGRLFG
jgi:hypothetical protein